MVPARSSISATVDLTEVYAFKAKHDVFPVIVTASDNSIAQVIGYYMASKLYSGETIPMALVSTQQKAVLRLTDYTHCWRIILS